MVRIGDRFQQFQPGVESMAIPLAPVNGQEDFAGLVVAPPGIDCIDCGEVIATMLFRSLDQENIGDIILTESNEFGGVYTDIPGTNAKDRILAAGTWSLENTGNGIWWALDLRSGKRKRFISVRGDFTNCTKAIVLFTGFGVRISENGADQFALLNV